MLVGIVSQNHRSIPQVRLPSKREEIITKLTHLSSDLNLFTSDMYLCLPYT
jgi:hypothetical protein